MAKLIIYVLNAAIHFLNDVADWFYTDWFD